MKNYWSSESGMVPNIGHFEKGDEVSADIAQKLRDAGYTIRTDEKSEKKITKGEEL